MLTHSRYPRFLSKWIGDEYLSTVRTISLTGDQVTDQSFGAVLFFHSDALQQVTSVRFRDCPITGKALSELASLPNITQLSVANTNVSDPGIYEVIDLAKLQELALENPVNHTSIRTGRISMAGIKLLSSLPDLKSLTLQHFYLDDEGLECIAKFKHLSTLNVQIGHSALAAVSDKGILQLKNMTCVRQLAVGGKGITDASMAILGSLTNLQHLTLFQTSVTDDGLKGISALKNLVSLNVYSPKLTDKCLHHLKGMPSLQYLSLPGRPSLSPELQSLRDRIWKEFNGEVPLVQSGISADAAKQFRIMSSPTLKMDLFVSR